MEGVPAWVGAGTIAGALVLAVVALVLHPSELEEGLFAATGWGWFWSCLIGAFVLLAGVRWRRARYDGDQAAEGGWDYVVLVGGTALVVSLIATNGVFLGAGAPDRNTLTPSEFRAGTVVCAVALGLVLLLTAVRRPEPHRRSRTLTGFGAGAFAVVLVGTLGPLVVGTGDGTRARHVVAGDPPSAVPLPDRVREAGWVWRPERGADVDRVEPGVHGPLVVLQDGVVALDGTDGTPVWSYRRPEVHAADEEVSVLVGRDGAYLTYTPVTDDDTEPVPVTEVFDLATGERLAEYTLPVNGGRLLGWSDGVRVHTDWRSRPEDDRAAGLSAWDAGTGAELWHRTLGTDQDHVCDGGRGRVRGDTVVLAVVCVDEDVVYEERTDVGQLVDRGEVPTVFRVATLDLRTGEELWSHERRDWEDAFVPGDPWVAPGTQDRGDALVVQRRSSSVRGLLLDPDTGEELLDLSSDLLEGDDDLSPDLLLTADGAGADVLFTRSGQGAEIQRVDTSGDRTTLVGAGGLFRDLFVQDHTVLSDQVLFTEVEQDTAGREPAAVLAVSPGERWGAGLDQRIVLSAPGDVRQLARAPGAVAALVGQEEGGSRVEGLVP
ncbi:PQQ-binding-like beta-propeller repeat protein [Nocardiopsis sp. NPDC007018]|uniref:outer membrane protein assembly factor BamB family protein n=1 Tax=Nocardiopsis sp. NPDC007018 TaxID=3155721 RepID=UPI0033FD3290